MPKYKIHAINPEGFHVEIYSDDSAGYSADITWLTDMESGWVTTRTAVPAGTAPAQASNGPVCQFCGGEVTGTPKIGNRGPFSAQQVAASRSEKLGKLGQKAEPACGKCWNSGWKTKWDAYFSANGR